MDLSTCRAVVTGGAQGIGLAIGQALLAGGARVVLSDLNSAALDQARAASRHASALRVVPADVRSAADIAALSAAAEAAQGPCNLWINNAGLARHRPIVEYAEDEIDLMLDVNLKGLILGSQAALRTMAPRQAGHIVNILSTASLRGIPTETVYCAAKWGARGFTQGLQEEAAPLGIRVTAVLPGGVDTGFWDHAAQTRQVPREKFLTPQIVADAVLALVRMDDVAVPRELVLRALRDRDFAS